MPQHHRPVLGRELDEVLGVDLKAQRRGGAGGPARRRGGEAPSSSCRSAPPVEGGASSMKARIGLRHASGPIERYSMLQLQLFCFVRCEVQTKKNSHSCFANEAVLCADFFSSLAPPFTRRSSDPACPPACLYSTNGRADAYYCPRLRIPDTNWVGVAV